MAVRKMFDGMWLKTMVRSSPILFASLGDARNDKAVMIWVTEKIAPRVVRSNPKRIEK